MHILVNDPISEEGIKKLKKAGYQVDEEKYEKKELVRAISKYDGLIVRSETKVGRSVIEHADRLKIIGRAGIGLDNIDLEAASEKGIVVKNAPHGNTNSPAELAMNLMGSLSRKVLGASTRLKEGSWEKERFMGSELSGKTVGIIGCGRIGQRVGRIARGFDMQILGYDVEEKDVEWIKFVERDELLRKSDFVTLHAPKQPDPIIGKEELKLMKPNAYLINVSRGGNVDEKALLESLEEEEIAGAALDVFRKEGKEAFESEYTDKLIKSPKTIVTPHLGASTEEAQEKTAIEIAEVLIEFLEEGGWSNAVNIGGETYRGERKRNNLWVTHANEPGMFSKVAGVFGRRRINIEDMPSRILGDGERAITIFKVDGEIDSEILDEVEKLDGVYRVTD